MAVVVDTYLYEILVRFDANGYVGAHVKDLEVVSDNRTGRVIAATESDPRPITQQEVGEYLTDAAAALIEAANDARAEARAQAEADAATIAALRAELDAAGARVDAEVPTSSE